MIELKKDFYIDSFETVKNRHRKNYINDLYMLKDIQRYTENKKVIDYSNRLYIKITHNSYLTKKDIEVFYNLLYLYYLKNFFPFSFDTIEKYVLKDYRFLLKIKF